MRLLPQTCVKRLLDATCPSAWKNSTPTARIFGEVLYWEGFSETFREDSGLDKIGDTVTGILYEDSCTFMTVRLHILSWLASVLIDND